MSLRKPLGNVQSLAGLPAHKEQATHHFSSFAHLPFGKEKKKDSQVLLTFRAEKDVPILLGFKNTISFATSWRRVATATHLTYLSGV